MSNETNTQLLELAQEHLDFWKGTVWAKVIRKIIDKLNYKQLKKILIKSATAMAQENL